MPCHAGVAFVLMRSYKGPYGVAALPFAHATSMVNLS